jgi:hypothetical protein
MTQMHDGDPSIGWEVEKLRAGLAETPVRSMNWSETMATAPRAIGILGECLLLTSHRRAALVDISGAGLG